MKVKNNLTPYPILSNYTDDYVNSQYSVNINSFLEFNKINIDVSFELKNDYLERLIQHNKAMYVVHIECPVTSYRSIEKSKGNINVQIPSDLVKNKIEVCTFIIAEEKIEDFYCDEFNKDYGNSIFVVQKGNKLAISEMAVINIKKNKDKQKDTESIIKIRKSQLANQEYVRYDLDTDYIIITLPERLFNLYIEHGKQGFKDTMVSSIILPIIVQALIKMKCENDEDSDIETLKWFIALSTMLRENNIDIHELEMVNGSGKKSIFHIAQDILENPIKKMMNEINRYGGEMNE